MTTILLGPQRFTTTAGAALRSLGIDGPVATVNSGWEEREAEDLELDRELDGRARNLRLFARMIDVYAKDPEVAGAAMELRDRRASLVGFYELRLRHAMAAVYDVQRRGHRHGGGGRAFEESIRAVRSVDRWYLGELRELRREVEERSPASASEVVAWHRGEVAAELAACRVVVVTGGHVGTLMETLRLFDVRLPAHTPVIAWSAGAMALTTKVVLFHDHAPQGYSDAQVWDRGLGRLPGLLVLPHARRRLRLDDRARMSVLARRFPKATALLLDDGARLVIDADGVLPDSARVITHAGSIHQGPPR
jgi:hypothetical protein